MILYIPIDLSHDNSDSIDKINIEDLYLEFICNPRNLIIYGNDISGKTSSLKYLINNLKNDFVTIYTDDIHNIQLPVKNFLANKKKQIYKYNFDREKTILFIDNFHKLNNDRMIKILKSAEDVQNLYFIFTVDSVFINNIKLRDLTKDKDILSHLQISMMCYYDKDKDKDKEMKLDSSEIKHIKNWNDTVSDFIFKKNIDPEENRKTLLKQKDYNDDKDEKYDEFDSTLIEMRKALKSIEVMGHILKNRFGSIKTKEFNEYLEFAMNLLFRIGGRLFNQLKEDEKYFVDYFYNELKDNEELINDKEKLLVEIRKLLFRYSLLIVISTVKRCTRTLLSDKLISFIEELNKDNNKRTELTILIEKDAKMTYDKSVNLKKLENYLKDNDKDDFLKNIYKFLIQEYLYFNKVSVQEKQKIFSICNFREKK